MWLELVNRMSEINLRVVQKLKNSNEEKLIQKIVLKNTSKRNLTASRAAKIIARELPRFKGNVLPVSVIKTEQGWRSYNYYQANDGDETIWEYVYVTEHSE